MNNQQTETAGTSRRPPIDEIARLNEDFLGGNPELFDEAGREQLIVLLEHGMQPDSTVLDIGCGCLRGGRWIIPLLEPGNYCGVEPMVHMVDKGLRQFLAPGIAELKKPRFDHNDRFDFSVFNTSFTHFLARSIWTHASKAQIETMLDGAARCGTDDFAFVSSFLPAKRFGRKDYKGSSWIGKSHESAKAGVVRHSFKWIRDAAAARGLHASIVDRAPIQDQYWCLIRRAERPAPTATAIRSA